MVPLVTRFAPSPTGHLHLGHAFSAFLAYDLAQRSGGRFILRIEDIDPVRCRPEFVDSIFEDLAWLGITWEGPVLRQSQHLADYRQALDRLDGLLYPCFCTRADIAREVAASASAPQGPDGPVYPGHCRHLTAMEVERHRNQPFALRLDMERAIAVSGPLIWSDVLAGKMVASPQMFGDIVVARKEIAASYHLAVTVDDARQGVTLVTRGEDLFPSTHLHRLLQALLGLPTPLYCHHRLLTDANGRRLAKRDGAITLRTLRINHWTREEIRDLFPDLSTILNKILLFISKS